MQYNTFSISNLLNLISIALIRICIPRYFNTLKVIVIALYKVTIFVWTGQFNSRGFIIL